MSSISVVAPANRSDNVNVQKIDISVVAPANRSDNVNFQKIYNRAKDKDVAAILLYDNGIALCIDDQHALTAKEVLDCCEQGCIVRDRGGFYRPVYWKEAGGVATVVCLDNSGTSGALAAKVFTSYQAS